MSKKIVFSDIKSGWFISYYFMTQALYEYTIEIPAANICWNKPRGQPVYPYDQNKKSDTFLYSGPDGELTCIVTCPDTDKLDNSFNEGTIVPSSGRPVLGRTYCLAFEDFGGSIDYNDCYINIVGWVFAG
ncbi:hypothetical protein J8V46_04605 [Xenorhabdus sp. PB30.3]|nr:hypothetical protein [Xenorhabdus sp. PB30.3]